MSMSKAVVLTNYGRPDVLVWSDVPMPEPGHGQVRIRIKAAGVSPSDLKIRRGDLQAVFKLPPRAVLGFEAAGVVDAVGSSVSGVHEGDEVASLLFGLGGYGEYVLTSSWSRKPPNVSWSDAAALPSSAEAAVGILKQLRVTKGETLLILGAAGSVGMIATQLAVARGLTVIGAASPRDQDLVRELGAIPVVYGAGLADRVRKIRPSLDAVLDAAGKGELRDAIQLAGGPGRVMTRFPWEHRTAHRKPLMRRCRSSHPVRSGSVASASSRWPTPSRRIDYWRTVLLTKSMSSKRREARGARKSGDRQRDVDVLPSLSNTISELT
jgi:NADPH:quinone reductase-like Zn-dependent oxidoreductase